MSKVEQDKVPASLGSLSHVLQPAILVPPGVIVPHLYVADICASAGGRTAPLVPPHTVAAPQSISLHMNILLLIFLSIAEYGKVANFLICLGSDTKKNRLPCKRV